MKGIICYYSGSGNTKLACEYLRRKIKNADLELYNIVRAGIPNFNDFDIIGFATFTDFLGAPQLFCSFVKQIEGQNYKPAFLFNTYGMISGKTLIHMEKLVKSRGFNVIAGYSLHTPENYPPNIKKGLSFDKCPGEKDIKRFNEFIIKLSSIFESMENKESFHKIRIKVKFSDRFLPILKRTTAKRDFGIQGVDEEKCIECGICVKGCPYGAIMMNPKPVFNHSKCFGCWYCYNHCKSKAIYTRNFKGDYQYPEPVFSFGDD